MTYQRFQEHLRDIQSVPSIVFALSLKPLPPQVHARHPKSNPLGLEDREDESLVIVLLAVSWKDAASDDQVHRTSKALMTDIELEALKLNALDRFIYLNYADPSQSPIASYGNHNVQRLRSIAAAIDPHGMFTTQMPGVFKIPPESTFFSVQQRKILHTI